MLQSKSFSRFITLISVFIFVVIIVADVSAQSRNSGLPLPRFVSLRADEVNMRTGPGVQYPVEWVYRRQGLPAEIIAEYGTWRKIRDWQGTQGWIHQSMLSGKRTFIVIGNLRTLRRSPTSTSAARVQAEVGVIGHFLECKSDSGWCRTEIAGHKGWIRRVDVWGVYKAEEIK